MANQHPDASHYAAVIDAIKNGRLIPFFGAGVNLCNRPVDYDWSRPWRPDSGYLPSGGELSHYLATEYKYPEKDQDGRQTDTKNLTRVSQFVAVLTGETSLDRRLHSIFDRDFDPTPLHEFFARLPALLREHNCKAPNLLIITTNYDDLMERALEAENEPFDVVSYIRDGRYRGKFRRFCSFTKETEEIKAPNKYDKVSTEKSSVVLKIHGAVDREACRRDDFVITEDNYIDFLTHGDIVKNMPILLREKFTDGQFLCLGYSLSDWNMRAFLNSVQIKQQMADKDLRSWAIQMSPDKLDARFWMRRDVDILDKHLREYVVELKEHLEASGA